MDRGVKQWGGVAGIYGNVIRDLMGGGYGPPLIIDAQTAYHTWITCFFPSITLDHGVFFE